ncbi:MAG: hypothetical protein V3V97_17630, partial [Hyphomicrobiaceae bacterium]
QLYGVEFEPNGVCQNGWKQVIKPFAGLSISIARRHYLSRTGAPHGPNACCICLAWLTRIGCSTDADALFFA